MIWPFVSRDRYREMMLLKDQRIAELEGERRMLWDKVCLLGIGAPAFAVMPQDEPTPRNDTQGKLPASSATAGTMRPSAIMRRMDRLAEAKWLRKTYPSRAAEQSELSGQQSAFSNQPTPGKDKA
jgi:hypothetical protein